jgi:hypothetical protein
MRISLATAVVAAASSRELPTEVASALANPLRTESIFGARSPHQARRLPFELWRIRIMLFGSLTARPTGAEMTDLEILDRNIIELKGWLNAAWLHLAKSSLTKFERGELRNEMKQCNAELRRCLEFVRAERANRQKKSSASKRSDIIKVNFKLIGQNPPA